LEFAFGGPQDCCEIVGSMGPAEGSEAGTPAAAGDEARLLVVEDEPTILELLSGSLRFAGFDVVTASSGSGART
jgi:two-component system OmpR family response regulator